VTLCCSLGNCFGTHRNPLHFSENSPPTHTAGLTSWTNMATVQTSVSCWRIPTPYTCCSAWWSPYQHGPTHFWLIWAEILCVYFSPRHMNKEPITVIARSKACNVFARSNTGIVGSNPTQGMDVCVLLFFVCVVLCVGSSLAMGWSPAQGIAPTV
jgi:hypothetical protein